MKVTVHSIYDKQEHHNIDLGLDEVGYQRCMHDMESTDKYPDDRYEYFGIDTSIDFKWDMTEEQFQKFMKTFINEYGEDDYCGAIYFGNLKMEFMTTPDGTYENLFLYGKRGYGALKDGTPYDELNGIADKIHIHPRRTFEAFARDIERQIIECANEYTQYILDMISATEPQKWYPGKYYRKDQKITREN